MIKTVDEFIELFEGIAEKVTLTIKETIMKKDTDPASTETTPDETQDETDPEENVETFRNRNDNDLFFIIAILLLMLCIHKNKK